EPFRAAGAVEADEGVEVDDAAALVLGDLGVLHRRRLTEPVTAQAEGSGDQPAQGDGEAAPQVRSPPLPHDLGGVVVAVDAQRLPQDRIVVDVPHEAAGGSAVPAAARGGVWAAAALDAVDVPERRRGEGGEDQRVVGYR